MPKLSKQAIDERASLYDKYFTGWRGSADEFTRLYRLDFGVNKHEEWDQYLTASAKRIVDDAVNNITTIHPYIEFYNPAETMRGEQRAEALELLCRSVFEQSNREAAMPVLRSAANDAFRVGMFCLKTLRDDSRWPHKLPDNADEREYMMAMRALNSPFIVRRVNPTSIIFDPSENSSCPTWVIEKYKRTAGSLKARFPMVSVLNKFEDQEEVTWMEYWDDEWRSFWCNDTEIATVRHGWGFCPYTVGYSGFGIETGAGFSAADLTGTIAERAVPILFGVKHLLFAESEILTQIVTAGAEVAYNNPVVKSDDDPAMVKARAVFQPGAATILKKDDELDWPPMRPGLAQLYQNLQVVRDLIAEGTYPPSVMGRRQPGLSSGYDRALAIGTGGKSFAGTLESLNGAGTIICSWLARLLETMTEPVSIYGLSKEGSATYKSISPDVVKHFYFCKFELKPNEPEDEERKQLTGMTLLNSGKFDEFPIMEKYFGITDPRKNMVKRIAQQIVAAALPNLIAAYIQRLAATAGIEGAIAPTGAASIGGQQTLVSGAAKTLSPAGFVGPGPLSNRAPGATQGSVVAGGNQPPQSQPRMGRPPT